MKASTAGIFSITIAIALVVTGIGVGIAQAGGTRSERPVLSFADMEALEQAGPSGSYVENRAVLSFEDEQILEAGGSPSPDVQLANPIETGSLPSGADTNSAVIEIGGASYRVGVDVGP